MTIAELADELEMQRASTRFATLLKICVTYFGNPRIRGSHYIFKMPWIGDPRLNLQRDGSSAKPYQVKQVVAALRRLEKSNSGD